MAPRFSDEDDDLGFEEEESLEDDSLELEDEEEEYFDDGEDDDDSFAEDASDFADAASVAEEAEEMIDAGEYRRAIALLQRAVEEFPEEAELHYLLGLAGLEMFRDDIADNEEWTADEDMVETYESAVTSLDEAVQLKPDHANALNGLAILYMMRNNLDAAIKCWEKSLEIDEDQEDIIKELEEARRLLDAE
ncbi:MAG: tetratricopeptide repeat protein [Candidatus Sumerlaeia bacterium]|nr:tetratricopeptide repeat protein [Candidatus Sumerlaeia bacterium]